MLFKHVNCRPYFPHMRRDQLDLRLGIGLEH